MTHAPTYCWEAPSESYPWVGRPHSGRLDLTVNLGTYFIQCEADTASDVEWWTGAKGYNGGPGIKVFALYAGSEPTPEFKWPFSVGRGEALARCEVETTGEAQAFFAEWLLALAGEAIQEGRASRQL